MSRVRNDVQKYRAYLKISLDRHSFRFNGPHRPPSRFYQLTPPTGGGRSWGIADQVASQAASWVIKKINFFYMCAEHVRQVSARRGSLIQFTNPSKLQNTERIGEITKKILHRYSPDAEQFAFEIYQALKLPWDPTSEEGKRELGCFASFWEKVAGWQNAGIPLLVLDELRERAIVEARKIANRRQNRKRGAVWCVVFKRVLSARCKVENV